MLTGSHVTDDGTIVVIDDTSAEAHRAAELARRLVRARLTPVPAAWGAELGTVTDELLDDPVMRGALYLALANLTRLALTGWAAELESHAEAPPTADDLLDHMAEVCQRRGLTI